MKEKNTKELFSSNLERLVKQKSIKSSDMSKELCIPATTISNWMTGETFPRVETLERLADYFGVKPYSLISDQEKKCKYCDITPNMTQEFITSVDYEFGKCLTAFEAILVDDTRGPVLGITVGDFVDETIPINYCPICGRKLR